jgi:hypothetical protein
MADTMSGGGIKSVGLPIFDGTHKTFQIWWVRFLAYSNVMKFKTALFRNTSQLPESDSTSLDGSITEQALLKIAKTKNATAMTHLTMAFTSEMIMGLVYKSMTAEWPEGVAYLVVELMMKKYKPQDTITHVELRQKLIKVSMKKGQDPSTIFEQIWPVVLKISSSTKHSSWEG